jgi:hypothetical protein
MSLLAKFIRGRSVTDGTVIEFKKLNSGKIEKFEFSNGGGVKTIVKSIPSEIEGFKKVKL